MAVQILAPLRHFAYPGEVSWTEEGRHFSWHMKLRDKEAAARGRPGGGVRGPLPLRG